MKISDTALRAFTAAMTSWWSPIYKRPLRKWSNTSACRSNQSSSASSKYATG